MQLPKILKILFAVLILIVIGEIGYYVYYQVVNKNTAPVVSDNPPASLNISELLPTGSPKYYVKDGVFSSSLWTSIRDGEIRELDISGGVNKNGFKYKLKLAIKRNQDIKYFYYTENEMKLFKIITQSEGKESVILFSDLKIGDKIRMNETIDLLKDKDLNLVELKITKI